MSNAPRRTHRKSRTGCTECKRRHIKCDESRPTCGNCSISSRYCAFLSSEPVLPAVRGIVLGQETSSPSPILLPPQSGSSVSSQSHQSSSDRPSAEYPPIREANMAQLELFNHCVHSDFGLPPTSDNPEKAVPFTLFVETALSYPFLMNEMLAFAALHLAHLNPAKASFYKHQSVGLQTHALSIFNREMKAVTSENGVSVLCFVWFMAMHILYDTRELLEADGYLNRFIHYVELHRWLGLITAEAWQSMLKSKISYVFEDAQAVLDRIDPSGPHTAELKRFIMDSEKLDDKEKDDYRDALNRIQWALSEADKAGEQEKCTATTFLQLNSWPVTVPDGFIRHISERVPEALVVLAYYAVLLHLCRKIWIIGNTGQLLIRSVRLRLDS